MKTSSPYPRTTTDRKLRHSMRAYGPDLALYQRNLIFYKIIIEHSLIIANSEPVVTVCLQRKTCYCCRPTQGYI